MKRRLSLIGIGLLAFALFLLARAPASLLAERLPPGLIALQGLQGTVWNGQAQQVITQGLVLGRTEWRWAPVGLLRARFGYRFITRLNGHAISGQLSSGLDGSLRLNQVEGTVPLVALAALMPTGFFTGLIDLEMREVHLENYWPTRIDADIKVSRLSALTTNPPTLLGDFQLVFEDQSSFPIQARVEGLDGPLNAEGELTLGADRRFGLNLRLMPAPGASESISNMLRFVGPPDAQGRHVLRHSGRL